MKKVAGAFIFLLSIFIGTTFTEASSSNELIIINKATNKLAFFENGKLVSTFSVATGRQRGYTPEGTFRIVNKIKNRPYYKDNIPGGDPRNPLGDRWLGLEARGTYGTTYAIHGNSNPASIGTYASSGCVRMFDDQVRWLFEQVSLYTPVVITHTSASFDAIAEAHGYHAESKLTAVSVDNNSPQFANSSVTINASATASQSNFRFLVFDGTDWSTLSDYSSSSSFTWKPDKPGAYKLKVQVKHKASDNGFDDEKTIPFEIILPGEISSFLPDVERPHPTATEIHLATKTNDESNNLAEFSIFNGESWSVIQSYSNAFTASWKPITPGDYKLRVRVKHLSSSQEFDDERTIPYTVYERASLEEIVTSKESPRPIHTDITLDGKSNQDENNLFKYSIFYNDKWTIVQEYSPNGSLSWTPTEPGVYKIKLEVKNAISPEPYDDQKVLEYTVFKPATIGSITTDLAILTPKNNSILLVTEQKKDTLYQFTVSSGKDSNVIQRYSKNQELAWIPTKPGSYTLRIEVKHSLSNKEYDDIIEIPYIVLNNSGYPPIMLPASVKPQRRRGIKVRKSLL